MQLKGKTAFITGGSSGIGLATAELFLRQGARLAIMGRDPARLADAARQLGQDVLLVSGDVCSAADLYRAAQQIKADFGTLDVLFVNAGLAYATPLADTNGARYDEIMNTNLKATFFTVQQLVPLMVAGGSIVLNTSWLNQVGTPGLSLLSASKAAVRSLARTWSAELIPRGIRVNAVSPGAIDTPIHGKTGMSPEQQAQFAARILQAVPMGRFGKAQEIASAALFLASDASSYILGSELVVDGGFSQL
jgi:NAD(P)-dependent dehydrogenase (short-subunit alcohol dehydrogenase family)